MAFTLRNSASRTAVRSSAPARKMQAVRCQAMPDFKAPIRAGLVSAATAAAVLSMTMGAFASEDLNSSAQRTASELGSKAQNAVSQIQSQANQAGNKMSNSVQNAQSSNPLEAVQSKIGNPLSGVQLPQVPNLGNPLQGGSDAIQSTADNIVRNTPFAGEKVSKSVPIEDAANAPDPSGKTKYT